MNNKRIIQIVDILLKQENYVTIDDISKQINVSNKTIRNDLKIVDQWLSENQLHLVKKTGVGICIEGEQDAKLKISETIMQKNRELVDYSPEARKIFIAMRLLNSEEHYRIYELANELYVSRATIHKDIIEVSDLFDKEKIKLHRKNNHGLQIEGKERNKRNLLIELMVQDNGYQMFRNIVNDDNYECDGSIVFAGLDINDDELNEFVRIVMKSDNPYLMELPFDTLVFVLLHIFVSFIRVSQKHTVTLSKEFLEELQQQPFFDEIKAITDVLADYYHIQFNEMEVRYLQVYCISLQNSKSTNESDEQEAIEVASALIDSWSEQLQLPLKDDEELFDSLYAHLYPAITRFRHNILIENPLIHEIHNLYKNTYKIAENSVSYINDKYQIQVSKEEIGYLALHLAAALDYFKEPLKTILVCNSGIGTNNLLINKLKEQIPEINIVDQESFVSIYERPLDDIELIISTIELHLKTTKPILKISPLLKDYDLVRLKEIIRKFYKIKNDPLLRMNKTHE